MPGVSTGLGAAGVPEMSGEVSVLLLPDGVAARASSATPAVTATVGGAVLVRPGTVAIGASIPTVTVTAVNSSPPRPLAPYARVSGAVPLQLRVLLPQFDEDGSPGQPDRAVVFGSDLLEDIGFRDDEHGFANLRCRVRRDLHREYPELAALNRIELYDTRNATLVWEGRLDAPGRTTEDGGAFEVTAVGPQSLTTDKTIPVVYIDSRLEPWEQADTLVSPYARYQVEDVSSDVTWRDRQRWEFPRGMTLNNLDRSVARYPLLTQTRQRVGRFEIGLTGYRSLAEMRMQIVGRKAGLLAGADQVLADVAITTSEKVLWTDDLYRISDGFEYFVPEVRLMWTGLDGVEVRDDVSVMRGRDARVQGERKYRDATDVLTYPRSYVETSEVVEDVVGRHLAYQVTAPSIANTTTALYQLTYEDGATARQVLDDISELEPDYRWTVWERDRATGLPTFNWGAVSSIVSLDLTTADGFSSPGSTSDVYNEVDVRWIDKRGRLKSELRGITSPLLASAGLTRRYRLDLGSQVGSQAQAQRAGDAFLAQHTQTSNNGQLRVSRPVGCLFCGRTLQPWELPRHAVNRLIRVRELAPRVDALNSTSNDSATVFRCVEAEYDSSSNSATLTLDAYTWAVERQISLLYRHATRLPRR